MVLTEEEGVLGWEVEDLEEVALAFVWAAVEEVVVVVG